MKDKRYTYGEYRKEFLPDASREVKKLTPYEQGVAAAKESLAKFPKRFTTRSETSKVKAGTTKIGMRPPYLTSRR